MFEYDIFLHAADDPAWTPRSSFTVYAVSDDAVVAAFPNADRIYLRGANGGCIFMRMRVCKS